MTTSARDAKRSEAIFDLERLRRLWEPLDEEEGREAEELHVRLAAMVSLEGIDLPPAGTALGEAVGARPSAAADLAAWDPDRHAGVGFRSGRAGVPADPRVGRQHVWTRTRELTLQRFPEHHPALLPYLDEIERLLAALGFVLPRGDSDAGGDASADAPAAEAAEQPSAEEAIARLPQLLQELEDLVEALGLQVPPY